MRANERLSYNAQCILFSPQILHKNYQGPNGTGISIARVRAGLNPGRLDPLTQPLEVLRSQDETK